VITLDGETVGRVGSDVVDDAPVLPLVGRLQRALNSDGGVV